MEAKELLGHDLVNVHDLLNRVPEPEPTFTRSQVSEALKRIEGKAEYRGKLCGAGIMETTTCTALSDIREVFTDLLEGRIKP